ncbi:MAG: hypothetical protein KKF85_08135 [Gammaproteobacteria bacterium]|nr:hypothetical protein [Rhodocyclaceae bacterium]MBU3910167.1 hypothetical protein [Gammaproteobacteria bacterium]MBU3989176.1 hypothetical protein [Gammaproteobacteria bacterium]MBU4006174.1 hypothetical protein [Gammaproteobacteria bacterium]MBU4022629.1 hypothetical protein [Gammaproteobacteria bacterium]
MKPNIPKVIYSSLPALLALAAGMFLAGHHPLSPMMAMLGCGIAMLLCALIPHVWLLLLPALLPIVDLAPWTGWLTFEEFDILVLGAAAGAWLHHGWQSPTDHGYRPSLALLGLVALLLPGLAWSFMRGIQDAGGFEFGWFQGYEGPMNSVRLAKSFLLAALFAPLLGRAMSSREPRGVTMLAWGMALGLAMAAAAATWERLAFPGLLNFSADYRTTALFWEMHVGGAALDGYLALTLPFAALLLLRAHGVKQLLPAAIILALGTYASLTTFSRGVYLAVLVSMVVMAFLLIMRMPAAPTQQGRSRLAQGVFVLIWVAVSLGLSYLVFRSGGYRALVAVLGCLAVYVMTSTFARQASNRTWAVAIGTGILLTAGALLSDWLIAKGVYWAYGGILTLAVGAILANRLSGKPPWAGLALAAALALPVAAAQVSKHWGGIAALGDAAIPLLLIVALAVWNIFKDQPVWPTETRKRGALLTSVFALSAVTAVFGGGTYMGDRFSTSEQDLAGRVQHWNAGLDLLRSNDDWLFGKGMGRVPQSFFFGAPGNDHPGGYRLSHEEQNAFLALSGPRYQIGYGEVLRITQRVQLGPAGLYRVKLDGRAPADAIIRVEICTKHLLYAETCAAKNIHIKKTETNWQRQAFELDGRKLSDGPWYAPQLVVFSIALETMGGRIDIDNLTVTDPQGRSVIANGDFSADIARWFFTSDHHHMPWHMKSMYLHVLFEQGIVGLATFSLLVLAALSRSLVGRRSYHPLAPAIIAGIVGFMVVGLFDSLLDVPRLAFLFFLLLLIGIQGRRKSQ